MSLQLYELRARARESGAFHDYCTAAVTKLEMVAKNVYHSAGMEGNAFTEGDTLTLLTTIHTRNEIVTKDLEGEYKAREINEITDLALAVEVLFENIETSCLEEDFILSLHESACGSAQDQDPGMYKTYNNYTMHRGDQKMFTPARKVAKAMEDLIEWYNSLNRKTIEDIAELKLRFIHIHPFADGNGRVSRLLLNWALITNEFPPITIEVGEKERYIELLNEYGDYGDVAPFAKFIEDKVIQVYTDILSYVQI